MVSFKSHDHDVVSLRPVTFVLLSTAFKLEKSSVVTFVKINLLNKTSKYYKLVLPPSLFSAIIQNLILKIPWVFCQGGQGNANFSDIL